MLPQILCCPDKSQCESAIARFITENGVTPANIHRIKREEKKRELAVAQIRSLQDLFYHYHTRTRVIIIEDYDSASEEAQNALLKILEEKTERTQIFLLVTNLLRVLPTIRSRSQIHNIDPNKKSIEVFSEHLVQAIMRKDVMVLSLPEVSNMTLEKALLLCDTLLYSLRIKLAEGNVQTAAFMKDILRTKHLLQENNLNPQLGIDSLILAQSSR